MQLFYFDERYYWRPCCSSAAFPSAATLIPRAGCFAHRSHQANQRHRSTLLLGLVRAGIAQGDLKPTLENSHTVDPARFDTPVVEAIFDQIIDLLRDGLINRG